MRIYGNFEKIIFEKNFVGTKEEGNEKFLMMRSVDFGRQKTNPRILKGAREPTANLNSGHIHGGTW